MKVTDRFGPGADWSCTTKGAVSFGTCVVPGSAAGDDDPTDLESDRDDPAADAAAAEETTSPPNDRAVRRRRVRQLDASEGDGHEIWGRTMEDIFDDDDDHENESLKGCAWCPIGDSHGMCLHSRQGASINDLRLPHVKCFDDQSGTSGQSTDDDVKFWNDAVGCHNLNARTFPLFFGRSFCFCALLSISSVWDIVHIFHRFFTSIHCEYCLFPMTPFRHVFSSHQVTVSTAVPSGKESVHGVQ